MSLLLPSYFAERSKYVDSAKPRSRESSTYLNKRFYIIYLPTFSTDATWRGSSEIVKEFLYTLDTNISFLKITQPSDPNFVACIAWKPTSNTIVRYKLWQNVGEILYVPLYNGEKIPAIFSIEIWNVKPENITEGVLITEDGKILITEDDKEILLEGSEIGTVETITSLGTALFHTSKMVLPTSYCESDFIELGAATECTDLIFDLDDFVPFDGDYYETVGNCGVTVLIKGGRLIGELVLQADDETWHRVITSRLDGNTFIGVDQDVAAPSLTPFIYMQLAPGIGYKVDIKYNNGYYFINVDQEPSSNIDYSIIYQTTLEDGLIYGSKLVIGQNGEIFIAPSQTNTVL
jgi:hypothetical protein